MGASCSGSVPSASVASEPTVRSSSERDTPAQESPPAATNFVGLVADEDRRSSSSWRRGKKGIRRRRVLSLGADGVLTRGQDRRRGNTVGSDCGGAKLQEEDEEEGEGEDEGDKEKEETASQASRRRGSVALLRERRRSREAAVPPGSDEILHLQQGGADDQGLLGTAGELVPRSLPLPSPKGILLGGESCSGSSGRGQGALAASARVTPIHSASLLGSSSGRNTHHQSARTTSSAVTFADTILLVRFQADQPVQAPSQCLSLAMPVLVTQSARSSLTTSSRSRPDPLSARSSGADDIELVWDTPEKRQHRRHSRRLQSESMSASASATPPPTRGRHLEKKGHHGAKRRDDKQEGAGGNSGEKKRKKKEKQKATGERPAPAPHRKRATELSRFAEPLMRRRRARVGGSTHAH